MANGGFQLRSAFSTVTELHHAGLRFLKSGDDHDDA
jgi:hypothetical protein